MSVVRLSVAAVWLLSPPVLAILALRRWKREERPIGLKAAWPPAMVLAVLANWILFVSFIATGHIGGFGSHYMTTRLAGVFLGCSFVLLVGSIAAYAGRWQLSLASFLMLALWFGSELVA